MTDINLSSATEPPPRLHPNQPHRQPSPPHPNSSSTGPSSPAPLHVSESMRRIQDMLSARKLTTADLLTYTHNSVTFTAQIMPDGSLKARAPHALNTSPTAPRNQSDTEGEPDMSPQTPFKLYSSPSEFASDMASSAPPNAKARGSVTVNGWNECKVNQRSLAVLRNEMLRSKKSDAPDPAQPPPSSRTHPLPPAAEPPAPLASEPRPPKPVPVTGFGETDNHRPGSQDQSAPPVREENNTAQLPQNGRKPPSPSKHTVPPGTAQPQHQSPGEEHSKHVSERNENSDSNPCGSSHNSAHALQPPRDASDQGPKPATQPGRADTNASQAEVVKSDSQNSIAKNALSTADAKEGNASEGPRGVDNAPDPALTSESPMDADKREQQYHSPEADRSRSPDSDMGNDRAVARDPAHSNSKKRMRSPAKHDVRKRKKKNRSDSPPSGARTPSSRKGEKKSKEGKPADLPSSVDVDMVELDPEAREAAAIAAQAEKEEASNRARRTTRLAAGKIKQVDYKASANPQTIRTYSPGQENEEHEGHDNSNSNEAADLPKSSRRRTGQNPSNHQLRSTRRVTRQRGSYEREVSSNDEMDHSGWRSGGTGGDKKQANHDDADEIVGSTRTNGMRNDRKRTRTDNRRGRCNHSGDMDRGNGGSRDSPENDSNELPEDDEDLNEEEDLEDDEDPENRTGALDLNIQDLTCIGIAIKEANSLDSGKIAKALQEQPDWKSDENKNKAIASYVETISSAILNLRHLVSLPEEEISVPEALAFVATDIMRLRNGPIKTGYAQRPTAILNRANKEESYRALLDRNRRKEQRDVEEARASLEREMESRRKSEIDSLYAEAQLSEVRRHVKREESRCQRIQNEISRYETLERDVKARFDKAKLVHEKLHNEKRASDMPGAARNDQHRQLHNGDEGRANGKEESPAKRRKPSSSPPAISGENIMEIGDDDGVKQLERAKEMARLQALIAARQAEIEDYQRMCVEARMTFTSVADTKSRLETELHVLQSVAVPINSSIGHGAPATHVMRSQKESGRKNEHKNGSGGARNGGNSRSKPHGRSGSGTPSRPNGSGRSRTGNGKHGEHGKGTKRKTSGKH